jgi:AraC-like DNA-binding protein
MDKANCATSCALSTWRRVRRPTGTYLTTARHDDAHACVRMNKRARATRFINEQFHRDLAISEIAAIACTSQFHFSRLFKQATGRTVHQYLTSVRVGRAKRMLATTDLSIADIGAAVGYESQSHFTTVFGKSAGITPAAYRRQSRGPGKATFGLSAGAPPGAIDRVESEQAGVSELVTNDVAGAARAVNLLRMP